MATETQSLRLEGDLTAVMKALERVDRATDASVAKIGNLAKAFSRAEQEANDLAAAAARVPKREGAAGEQAELERIVKLREREADEIEHQVNLLREIGGQEKKIAAAQDQALARRREAAELSKDQAAITRARREQDVAAARAVGAARADAAQKQKAATQAASERTQVITANWQKAAAAVVALVGAVKAADAAMERTFGQRTVLENLPFQIGKAREATLGFVDDVKLSEVAITAQRLKIVSSEEEFGKLTEAATKLGLSVGRDTASAVEDLTGALGRGSTEVLDNLGIQLKVAEAQRLYAQQLGITTKALSAEQKAEAFRVIGLQKAIEAADKVTVSVQSQEQAWFAARREFDKLVREQLPEVTKRLGGAWEVVREGTELVEDIAPVFFAWLDGVSKGLKPVVAVVGFFGSQLGGIARGLSVASGMLERTTDRLGDFTDGVSEWVSESVAGDAVRWLAETGEGVVALADEGFDRLTDSIQEQIPITEELATAWDEVTTAILGTDAAVGTLGLGKQLGKLLDSGKQLAKQEKASASQRIADLKAVVGQSEFAVSLAEAQERPASELERLYRAQHEAKLDLLRATGDQAALESEQQAEQIRLAKAQRRGRGGGGPSRAEQLQAAGEIQLEQWRAEITQIELVAQLRGTADRDAEANATVRHNIAIQELELERQVLEITRGKNKVERARNEARLEAIDGEIEILNLQKQGADQEKARTKQLEDDEKALLLMDREIERLQSLGVATQMLERDRTAAARAQLEAHGTSEELAEFDHDRLIEANELRRQHAAELAQSKLDVFNQDAELAQARGQQVEELASRRLALQAAVAQAEGNSDKQRELLHKRDVARIKESAEKRKAAASAASSLLTAGQSLFSTVIGVAIKDEKKREQAALRARGVEAVARGALETVEAVAAFASFNFVQGALHTAAAAVAFTQGGIMLAGKIPSQSGASAASSGGGAGGPSGDHQVVVSDQTGSGRGLPSTPPSAEALVTARGGGAAADTGAGDAGQGGTVINISGSTLVAGTDSGGLFDDLAGRKTAKQWGT
jgi:hypothetical protein